MNFALRPYQKEAIEAARDRLTHVRAGILKLATGCGKTIIAAGIAHSAASRGKRVLFVAHTDELVQQAGDKVSKAAGLTYDIEKAKSTAHGSMCPLVVASVQSLCRKDRLERYGRDAFNLVVIDECHRGAADSYVRIIDHFSKAKVLGLTATPFRSDDKALADVFDEVVFDYGLEKAIKDGWLCPIVSETIPLGIDLSGVHIEGGDYKKSELGKAVEPVFDAVAKELRERAGTRKLCVFLPVIDSSIKFAEILRSHGFDAEHIDGKSKDRAEILARFSKKGPGSALCNSALLSEGWDEPSVDCVVDLTPTRSTLRYIQKIGRGTRLSPETGKKNLYVPDFLWHGASHNLCHPACLVAKTKEVADKMASMAGEGAKDLRDLEQEAHAALVSDREEALARSLHAFTGNKSRKFDPVLQSVSLIDDSLVDWRPETKSEGMPATEAQTAYLERHGFDPAGWKKGYASRVIDIMVKRTEQGLATPRMVRCLLKNGYPMAHSMSFEDAKRAMAELSRKWNRMNKQKGRYRK